jgi:hypothetical protein
LKKSASKKQKIEFLKNSELTVELLEDVSFQTLTPPPETSRSFREKDEAKKKEEWQTHYVPKGYQSKLRFEKSYDFFWLDGTETDIDNLEEEARDKCSCDFRGSFLGDRAFLLFSARDFIYYQTLSCYSLFPNELIQLIIEYTAKLKTSQQREYFEQRIFK